MENYITASELALLLAVFWLPVFAVAAIVQWRLPIVRRRPAAWLIAASILEVLVAFGVWLSPIHQHFLNLDLLGIGQYPLQAAVIAAIVVTTLFWAAGRRHSRPAP